MGMLAGLRQVGNTLKGEVVTYYRNFICLGGRGNYSCTDQKFRSQVSTFRICISFWDENRTFDIIWFGVQEPSEAATA